MSSILRSFLPVGLQIHLSFRRKEASAADLPFKLRRGK
jgi:hypothetical protein